MANKSVAVRLDLAVFVSLGDHVRNGGASSISDYLRRLIDDDADQRQDLAEWVKAQGMGAAAHIEVVDDLVHVVRAGG